MSHIVVQLVIGLMASALLLSPILLANNVDLNQGDPEQSDLS